MASSLANQYVEMTDGTPLLKKIRWILSIPSDGSERPLPVLHADRKIIGD
jgi:hypothetical protein